ncbi:UNVERIFIED_CONTAM: hypothetical protein FKN15_033893 [Acipenser sinensis]
MPTIRKTMMFLGGSLANCGSLIMICAVLATKEWVNSVITCEGSANHTGSVTLEYGLFEGKGESTLCPNFGVDINPFKAIFIFLSIVLFVVNTEVYHLSVEMAENRIGSPNVILSDAKNSIGYSYYLMIPAFFCNLFAIIIVYVYQHANYTQRKEQQRPTEDAPKDVLMY